MNGAELARGFWADMVAPLIAEELSRLAYAAGRLGSGSDVLGLDDAISRDHDWGCRLTILVDARDRDVVPELSGLLDQGLPERYHGRPVRFRTTWDPVSSHRVDVATVGDFAASRLGVLLAEITDPEVAALPSGIGPVERWADSVDVLSSPGRRMALREVYRSWSS
jgi:hypothetical protein